MIMRCSNVRTPLLTDAFACRKVSERAQREVGAIDVLLAVELGPHCAHERLRRGRLAQHNFPAWRTRLAILFPLVVVVFLLFRLRQMVKHHDRAPG